MAMTMTQKILARHAGLEEVRAGQLIQAKLDLVLGNDITTPVAINEFAQLLCLGARLVDPLLLSDVHLQQLQARGDDGDGGFQLVAGVGDELFLFSVGLHDRLDGAA